jgi:predicted glutamine amidotransferase
MCIAIVQLPGHSIEAASLWHGWNINNHGGGFAFLDDKKKVKIDTGYLTYNEFERRYREVTDRFGKNGPMLIHMRIRSAGGMGQKNCHPFKIKNGAMIHNGTLFHPKYDAKDKEDKSDTRLFAEALYNILDLESVKRAEKDILSAVGSYNKLAFLYDGGDYHIMNENYSGAKWDENHGIWYSNSGCDLPRNYSRK